MPPKNDPFLRSIETISLDRRRKLRYEHSRRNLPPNTGRYNIVCPFCFEEFNPEYVFFRATYHDNSKDDMRLQVDSLLESFWKNIDETRAVELLEPILNPNSNNYRNGKIYDGQVLKGLIQPNGTQTYDRICPRCHNKLPVSAGHSPSNIVSVIGGTAAGKTVFITILLHYLTNKTGPNFDFCPIEMLMGQSQEFTQKYLAIKNKGHRATPKEYIYPQIFDIKFPNDSLTICMYDFPGEAVSSADYIKRMARHLHKTSAILLLADPTNIASVTANLGTETDEDEEDEGVVRVSAYDVITGLINFVPQIFGNGKKTSVPTAIVYTKSDLLEALTTDPTSGVSATSRILQDFEHRGFLDLDEVSAVNSDVLRFVQTHDRRVETAAKNNFLNYNFFAVSSLGYPTEDTLVRNVISPKRVDEPFLWLLYQLGFISGRRIL